MIRVVFFAGIRESLGMSGLDMDADGLESAADVLRDLRARGRQWQDALGGENVLVAVNQTMVEPGAPVADGDEVAFFPPVTGG